MDSFHPLFVRFYQTKRQEVSFLAGDLCLYPVVREAAASMGWRLIRADDNDECAKRNCHVIWIDRAFKENAFLMYQKWQRINHFPGMVVICNKAPMARNLDIMRKEFPKEYDFYPTTYVLPQDYGSLKSLFPSSGQSKVTYIIKPSGGAQGKGIFLTRSLEDVENLGTVCVAQPYITNPLLIDGKKFDLRIYVLVTSCTPLRVYLFRDGLVRMCAEEYEIPTPANMEDRCMHLTNYAVNKHSDRYERDDRSSSTAGDRGCKRSIRWFLSWLRAERGEDAASDLWSKIGDICALTIVSILPLLRREYSTIYERRMVPMPPMPMPSGGPDTIVDPAAEAELSGGGGDGHAATTTTTTSNNNTNVFAGRSRCFELLGYDIMVDSDLRPILIEVNHLPSWGTDSPLDQDVKFRAITQALRAIDVSAQDKKTFECAKRRQGVAPIATRRGLAEGFSSDDNADARDIKRNNNQPKGDAATIGPIDRQRLDDEERILKDYDRIYPPSSKAGVNQARYSEMEMFAASMDAKQHQRLTRPSQQKYADGDVVENQKPGQSNRRDSWMGNIPRATTMMEGTKISRPPTKKQIESADRLSRGYSVEDTAEACGGEKSSARKKSRILHNHDFIYEEENPCLRLIDRVQQSQEQSKEARKRAETKLNNRASSKSPGTALKQQVLSLGLEVPVLTEENCKFYSKGEL